MRNLTIKKPLNDGQIQFLERLHGKKFPLYFSEFIKVFSGKSVIENTFYTKEKPFTISSFCTYRMMYDYIKSFKEEEGFLSSWIPFALDVGGWLYCILDNEDSKKSVYLFQMEMPYENEQEAFELVADSFEEFINGLQPEGDVS